MKVCERSRIVAFAIEDKRESNICSAAAFQFIPCMVVGVESESHAGGAETATHLPPPPMLGRASNIKPDIGASKGAGNSS